MSSLLVTGLVIAMAWFTLPRNMFWKALAIIILVAILLSPGVIVTNNSG